MRWQNPGDPSENPVSYPIPKLMEQQQTAGQVIERGVSNTWLFRDSFCQTVYTDDEPVLPGTLYAAPVYRFVLRERKKRKGIFLKFGLQYCCGCHDCFSGSVYGTGIAGSCGVLFFQGFEGPQLQMGRGGSGRAFVCVHLCGLCRPADWHCRC